MKSSRIWALSVAALALAGCARTSSNTTAQTPQTSVNQSMPAEPQNSSSDSSASGATQDSMGQEGMGQDQMHQDGTSQDQMGQEGMGQDGTPAPQNNGKNPATQPQKPKPKAGAAPMSDGGSPGNNYEGDDGTGAPAGDTDNNSFDDSMAPSDMDSDQSGDNGPDQSKQTDNITSP